MGECGRRLFVPLLVSTCRLCLIASSKSRTARDSSLFSPRYLPQSRSMLDLCLRPYLLNPSRHSPRSVHFLLALSQLSPLLCFPPLFPLVFITFCSFVLSTYSFSPMLDLEAHNGPTLNSTFLALNWNKCRSISVSGLPGRGGSVDLVEHVVEAP